VRRIALLLEYDGAAYGGSQRQRNAPSVQAVLEAAVQRLTGEPVRVAFAGRTDAGVHASGQVAAFTTAAAHDARTWTRALNALLPADVVVRDAAEVALAFDPRRQARGRWYRYLIWNAPVRSPLWRRVTWHVPRPLDTAAMAAEAAALVGEHDLAAFAPALAGGRSSRRRVWRAEVRRRGPLIAFEMEANAFLPHQMRRTAGALAAIGGGRLTAGTFARWLADPRPGLAGPAAPPHGLCLVRVRYDDGGPFRSPPASGTGERRRHRPAGSAALPCRDDGRREERA
jgi:tRNA pseudouridine38-40 synthase